MKRSRIMIAAVGVVAMTGISTAFFPALRDAIGIAHPDSAEFSAGKTLFSSALSGSSPDLSAQAAAAGFQTQPVDEQWQGTLFKEQDGQCEGRGVYLIRNDANLPLALTAPHRGFDRHTGTLAAQLFTESNVAAAAWNSAPRKPSADCPNALDLAKAKQHPFTAFALAFAEQHPRGRIVQFHGFDRGKRTDDGGRDAGVILSNGTTEPDDALLNLADCLSIMLDPSPVRVFPLETGDLGALTNAQGAALRDAGFSGFVHLELDANLRLSLTQDAGLRGALQRCLAEGLE